ncbi:MAG: hypothetical protein HZB43_10710 [candidate division Zixibacteria bacterium]|nr:hypothetical protein [candidate division Zixibacteria bacterium]
MCRSRIKSKSNSPIHPLRIALLAAGIFILGAGVASAVESVPATGPIDPHQGMTLANLSDRAFLAQTMDLVGDPIFYAQASSNSDSTAGMYGYESKSPKRAFAQSFLIPGWGQWYNGSRVKPFVFLGLEASGWLLRGHFRSQGNKKQTQYQSFADNPAEGWDVQKYLSGLQAVYGVSSDTMRYINPDWIPSFDTTGKWLVFSHHIYFDSEGKPIKNQTYYENVGKYDQFVFGWSDFPNVTKPEDTVGVEFRTPHRDDYLGQRASANREFSHASTVLILTIGNHLLSAFEAAIGAAHHNKSMDQFGSVGAQLRFVQSPNDGKLYPKFAVGYRF